MRIAVLILLSMLAVAANLFVGSANLSVSDVLSSIVGQGDPVHTTIVRELRIPRALLAAVIGAGLGASGAALQGFTRNPLAGPGILGFSAMAALGAVVALYFGQSGLVIPAALFTTALGALLLVMLIGRRHGRETLILAGVGVGALATAMTGLLMNFAPNPWALSEIAYWLMGSTRNADIGAVMVSGVLTLAGLAMLVFIGRDLRTLTLGEDVARTLGVDIRLVQLVLVAGTALCVGSGVAVAGAIGFVGLFVPHIVRFLVTSDPARLIPLSALVGAGVLALADLAAKLLSGEGTQLYLGILTSLVGVPIFLWLAVRRT